MFTTNTVQAGTVPALQYQDHPQKSQGKNIDNVQQKPAQQTQQTQQVLICNKDSNIKNTRTTKVCNMKL